MAIFVYHTTKKFVFFTFKKKLTSPLPSHFAAAFNQNLLHFHSLKITSIQIGVETHFFTSRWKLEVTLNRAALAYCVVYVKKFSKKVSLN